MEHTPGPWNIVGDALEREGSFTIQVESHIVAEAYDEADARLIAAAPDLLQAATAVLTTLEVWATHAPDDAAILTSRDILRAAIAKAEAK